MPRPLPLRAALPALVLALSLAPAVAPAEAPVAQSRTLAGPFTAVRLRGPYDLVLREGSPASAVVTAGAALQAKVTVEVRDGTLVVEPVDRDRERWDAQRDPVEVAVTLPELRALEVAGSGRARAETGSAPRDLALAVGGSGSLAWKGTAAALDLKVSGSGDLSASGPSREVAVAVSGSGKASYDGRTGPAQVAISGSGGVRLAGEGTELSASTAGSGSLHAGSFPVRDAQVSISGSGDMALRLTGGRLAARIAGSGNVTWQGEATVEASSSGSGKVTRG
jgi:hypothetical protein